MYTSAFVTMYTTRTLSIFADTSRRQILRVRQKEPVKKIRHIFYSNFVVVPNLRTSRRRGGKP